MTSSTRLKALALYLILSQVSGQTLCSCGDGSNPQPLCFDASPCYTIDFGAPCATEGVTPIADMCIDTCEAPVCDEDTNAATDAPSITNVTPGPTSAPTPTTTSSQIVGPLVSTVASLENAITQAFDLGSSYGDACNPCQRGDDIGGLLRLAFHDAVGGGGANGCLDIENTLDHAGLQEIMNTLTDAWLPFASEISFADTIALAGAVAIRYASTTSSNNGPEAISSPLILETKFGRVDADECNDVGHLPNTETGWPELITLFGSKFGMSIDECVAIMGAHTTGQALRHSGTGVDIGTGTASPVKCSQNPPPILCLASFHASRLT